MSSRTYETYLEEEYVKYLEEGGDDVPVPTEKEFEEMIKQWENTRRRRNDDAQE